MSTLTTTRPATLPRVNLLPEEIAEERRFRVIQGGLAVAVLAAVGVVGVLFLSAAGAVGNAQEELAAAQSQQTVLQRKVRTYRHVPVVYAQVEKAEAQVVSAFGNEVRWSLDLNEIRSALPVDLVVNRLEILQAVNEPSAPTVQGVDEGGAVVGKISLSGTMISRGTNGNREQLADHLDALADGERYANPYFTVSGVERDGKTTLVKFESTVDVNEQALSRRFTGKGK